MNCAQVLTSFGRLMFLLLMIAQCLLFASFPAKYRDNSAWYAFLLFITPALGITWWWITSSERKKIQPLLIWFSYTWLGLVPMIGIVFGLTAEKLDRSQQFGPNELKISLGITPLLLLLLLYTGHGEVPPQRRNMIRMSFFMVIDVFDSNDLLRMVIDEHIENTQSFGIPRSFVRALLSFACIAFLLSPLELLGKLGYAEGEDEEDDDAFLRREQWVNGVIQAVQVCLNVIILGLRLGVLRYGLDVSMFIAKNVIMIFFHPLECSMLRRDREVERDAEKARQRNPLPPPTAPPPPLPPFPSQRE